MAEAIFDTPIGPLLAETTERGLRRLAFMWELRKAEQRPTIPVTDRSDKAADLLARTEQQINEYFDGTRRDFDLPLDLQGSDFQVGVWRAIAAIPFGETVSYAEVAARAGRPGAYRAAGAACGANRIVLVVPCHRVVGSDRALHGFGGGLDVKARLLKLEGSLDGLRGGKQSALALA